MDEFVKLLKADESSRRATNCLIFPGVIRFACPICDDCVVSDYRHERGRLTGLVECETCKIALVIYEKMERIDT